MNYRAIMLAMAATCAVALPSYAHHSFAMFDNSKMSQVTGTVKEFEYINPHSWLHVSVPQGNTTVTWSFEMGSVAQLVRDGWNRESVKVGDQMSVNFHPLRDGSNGGQFRTLVFADGRKLCQGGAGESICK